MVAKKITSLQHPLIKHWFELRTDKTYREENQELLIVGEKMVRELPVETLISLDSSDIACKELIIVTLPILKKITGLQAPDGFAATISMPKAQNLEKKRRILICDRIADPGNLGTLMRTALALGWDGIVVTPNTVDLFNDKVLRAAKGAHFHLSYARLSEEKIAAMGYHLYTADLHGESIEKLKIQEPLALILSSEGHGPGSWSEKIAKKVTIPMQSQVESLNVASSGAILLYQLGQS